MLKDTKQGEMLYGLLMLRSLLICRTVNKFITSNIYRENGKKNEQGGTFYQF